MLSTPPAFVLSQDQTLHRDPLATWTSKPESRTGPGDPVQLAQDGLLSVIVLSQRHAASWTALRCGIEVDILHLAEAAVQMPALAFNFLCSVFKEHRLERTQPDRLEVQQPC